jgi:hypothetical protein
MTAAANADHAVVPPDWTAISLACAAGITIGLLPYLLYTRAAFLAVPLFLYVAIVVPWRGRRFVSHATEPPEWREWILAAWNAVGTGATASFTGFVWYGAAYFATWAIAWIFRALGWRFAMAPHEVAIVVSAVIVAAFALTAPLLLAGEMPQKLYPRVAGTRSAYFAFAAQPRKMNIVAGGVVGAILVGASLLGVTGLGFTLSLTFLFILTASPLMTLQVRVRDSEPEAEALHRLKAILAAAGYEVTQKPGTGNPELDPLIAPIDLLALGPGRGFAIEIKFGEIGLPAAFDVRTGAQILQRMLREGGEPEAVVEPYLLAIGGAVADELLEFAGKEGIRLVRLADVAALPEMEEPRGPKEISRLEKILDLLGLEPARPLVAREVKPRGPLK